jgi:hypothetical protein
MKLSKLQKLAWVFFALALTTTTVYSQDWRNGIGNTQNQNGNCLSYISDLNEKQQKQILEMEEKHQEEMATLRDKRRSTANAIEKNEIRGDMLKKVKAHQNAVKKLLNKDQQKQYDQLHSFGVYGRIQNLDYRNGNENFQGRGRYAGGPQFGRGNRGGRCYANWNNNDRGNGRFYAVNNRGGYGKGNFRAGYGNRNFQGNRGNFGRGYGNGSMNGRGRFYWQNNATSTSDVNNEK